MAPDIRATPSPRCCPRPRSRGRSGRDLITATVLAYEVFCKIADIFDYLGNGIDHSTITGMAAVVGAGRLMGLSPDQMVQAIGITVGGDTATRQGRSDALSNWKAFAAADACRKAIFSVELAQERHDRPGQGVRGHLWLLQGDGQEAGRRRRSSASPTASAAPLQNAFRSASSRRPWRRPPSKRGPLSKARTRSPRSTSASRTRRSRSWPTVPRSGNRRRTRPPTTASPMRRAWC